MRLVKIYTLISFIIISFYLQSQTSVSGGIFSTTTWSLSNSPYIVTGDIVVFSGATLNIQPGVEVKVDNGKFLYVRGYLKAIGNINDTIVFHSSQSNPGNNAWEAISIQNDLGGKANLKFCKVMDANFGFQVEWPANESCYLSRCLFTNNNFGNYGYTGSFYPVYIDSCSFVNNTTGVASADKIISNCIFKNNVNGVDSERGNITKSTFEGHSGYALRAGQDVTHCTIRNNNIGIWVVFNGFNKYQYNSIYNNGIGIKVNNILVDCKYNTICNNSTYNLENLLNSNTVADNNCWCITDSSLIEQSIFSGYDNINYGLVDFMPLYGTCSSTVTQIEEIDKSQTGSLTVYPNPFKDKTSISINLPKKSEIKLELYDLFGKINTVLLNQPLEAGDHKVNIEEKIGSGIFLLVLKVNEKTISTFKLVSIN